jgi:outer membrane protein
MNKQAFIKSILSVFFLSLFLNSVTAQSVTDKSPADSLNLKSVILKVISTYPTVKVAEEAILNADSRISLARTGYNPEVDMTASYAHLGPVTKLTFPSFGTVQFYPGDNYSASVNFKQLVYDFGRTRQNVELENEGKAIGEQTLEQIKQKLSIYTINSYYSLLFLQAAIKIKDEQISALNEHLQYIQKVLATGSATEYQVLTTKVKISSVESQRVDLVAALTAQQAALNSLMGNDQYVKPVVRNEVAVEQPVVPSDSILSYAFSNRDEVLINEKRTSLAELKFGMIKLQNKPILSLQATAGAKNGYMPDLYKFTPNYVVGLGFRVPIFDGMKTKYNLAQAQSAITTISYESEFTRRGISNEVFETQAMMIAASKKVSQSELQLEQAKKAYSLAQTSFKSGMITNLDLLDASTSVSESSLALLKSKIEYATSIYRLKAALGQRIY